MHTALVLIQFLLSVAVWEIEVQLSCTVCTQTSCQSSSDDYKHHVNIQLVCIGTDGLLCPHKAQVDDCMRLQCCRVSSDLTSNHSSYANAWTADLALELCAGTKSRRLAKALKCIISPDHHSYMGFT